MGPNVSAGLWCVLVSHANLTTIICGFLWLQIEAKKRPESPFASNSPRTVTHPKQPISK